MCESTDAAVAVGPGVMAAAALDGSAADIVGAAIVTGGGSKAAGSSVKSGGLATGNSSVTGGWFFLTVMPGATAAAAFADGVGAHISGGGGDVKSGIGACLF